MADQDEKPVEETGPIYNEAGRAIQRTWANWLPDHMRTWYDLEAFRKGQSSLDALQLNEVGSVQGKRLLHLMCNIGVDTLSWARAGAEVTGIDFTPETIAAANQLKMETGLPHARFICANVYQLKEILTEPFDVVYTSLGVLCWLNDLRAWADVIAAMLKPGGFFYLFEEHPTAVVLDRNCSQPTIGESYFGGKTLHYQEGGSEWYEWQWTMGDVVSSLAGAGLRIDFLHEFDRLVYQRLPLLRTVDQRWWHYPDFPIPLTFSIKASRPE